MSDRERRVVAGAYRCALGIFPQRIRHAYAREMEEMFLDAWRAARARGAVATIGLVIRTARDLGLNGLAARYEEGMGMDGWRQDAGHALRGLIRRPGFTAVAVLTLALGIGGNTAIYSILDAAYIDALPYPDADDLVIPYNSFDRSRGIGFAAFSAPFHFAMRESGAFAGVASLAPAGANLGGADRPERVPSASVSGEFFDVVGVLPALGRAFAPEDDRPGAPPVVVVSDGLWTRRFARDPSVVGRTVVVDDVAATIVGVMPPGFSLLFEGIEMWQPYRTDPATFDGTSAVNNNRVLIARRLPPRERPAEAGRLQAALADMHERFPDAVTDAHGVTPVPLREHLYGNVRSHLLILLGAVGLVLLIACANLGNLLMVRAEERRAEMAVRAALGAPRGRLVRGLVLEAMLLSLLGGSLGALVATWTLGAVRPLAPANVPLPELAALDGSVLLFTLTIALVAGLLFGLAPAWSVAERDLRAPLLQGSRAGTSRGRSRIRGSLVIGEVALTAVLLVGSGLLLNSMWRLQSTDPGFTIDDRSTFPIRLGDERYGSTVEALTFYRDLLSGLDATPAVGQAGLTQFLPLDGNSNWGYEVEGLSDAGVAFSDYNLVTPGYLQAVGMTVLQGRDLTWADAEDAAEPVVMVSEAMARRLWSDESAVGHRINVDLEARVWRRIVGVVSDVRNRSLSQSPADLIYFPPTDLPMSNPRFMNLVVHHPGTSTPLTAVQRAIARLDPSLPVTQARALDDIARASESRRIFMLTLLGMFAALALTLAAVGLYGVVSYTFSLRTREIGLRMAMGARRSSVLGLVLTQSARLVGSGLALGLVASSLLARLLGSLLYEVSDMDLVTYLAASVFLTLIAALATWVPASRASAVDPATVLRG